MAQSDSSYYGEEQEMVSQVLLSMLNAISLNQLSLFVKLPLEKYLVVSQIKIGLLLPIINKLTMLSYSRSLIKRNIILKKITIKVQYMLLMLIQIIYPHLEEDMMYIWLKIVIKIAQVMPTSTIHMIQKEEIEMI